MAEKKPNYTQRLRSEITDAIVKSMKEGHLPWRQPWGNGPSGSKGGPKMYGMPCNFLTGKSYKGINPLLLMMAAENHGFQSRFWGTHKQWGELGAYVKPHPATVAPKDWGTRIVFHTMIEKELSDEKKTKKKKPTTKTITAPKTKKPKEGEEETEKIFFLRSFTLFNAEQVAAPEVEFLLSRPKALDAFIKKVGSKGKTKEEWAQYIHDTVEERLKRYLILPEEPKAKPKGKKKVDIYKPAEELMLATGADIRYGGNRAFYRRRPGDFIQLPEKGSFDQLGAFYETAFHELVHWSEDDKRLGRHKVDGDKYAYGELVAEIGACFLAQQLGVPFAKALLPNTTRYLKHWLTKMGDDPKFIFKASGEASKRADYLLAFVGQDEKDEESEELVSTAING